MGTEPPADVRHVSDGDATLYNTTLCLDKQRGVLVNELHIFSRALGRDELMWLRKISIDNAAKRH
jgi:hypothetical protein